MVKEPLFGKTIDELRDLCETMGLPGFTASQLADWLYRKTVTSVGEMTNLSKRTREALEEKYVFGLIGFARFQESSDGTRKYLFETHGGRLVETAMIPEAHRTTVCVSSQVGCKRRCLFCMTGRQGLQGQLTAGEIVAQVRAIPERNSVTNIVYMGMGEPFDNLDEVLKSTRILTEEWGLGMSPRRITVSSIGLIPELRRFLRESEAHLAISLHTPFADERFKLMPVELANPIDEVIYEIRQHEFGQQRRVSFEYIVFHGLNDTPRHVKELARLLNGMRCRINLIRFHPIPETPLNGTDEKALMAFKDALMAKGIITTIRASRGQDIFAACGLLSSKNAENYR